ncbi:hypothetical protein ACFX1Q_037744 [Malus domestica]|uniref:Uncharacterized protein n=1 Tax=Malus domestica TaxID=3750 RepID=A0A498JTX8_MALDO|nr:hypothetical protein DVH24_035942 [Malus domestica]
MMQKVMEEAIWRSVCDNCPSLSSLSTNDGDGTGKNLANIGPGSSCVIPSTALTNSVKRQPSLKDHGHMLHFDNFRTFYINGSLTLVVNDLNLDKMHLNKAPSLDGLPPLFYWKGKLLCVMGHELLVKVVA